MPPRKMHFAGALSFPLDLGGGLAFDPARLDHHYQNNEQGLGGWYPLGASQTWHNGIHLHTGATGQKVHAIAGGTIVAARLGEDERCDPKLFPFGSPRFVLIRHELSLLDDSAQRSSWDTDTWTPRDVVFYSLYMHIDTTFSKMEDVPWLATYRSHLRQGATIRGDVRRIVKPDGKNAVSVYAEPKPVDGAVAQRPAILKTLKVGELVDVLPGEPVEAMMGGLAVEFAKVRPLGSAEEGWIRVDGDRLKKDELTGLKELQNGAVATLGLHVEAGECLGHTGPLEPEGTERGAPQNGVHLEVFSETDLVAASGAAGWIVLEDTSADDVICDARSLVDAAKAKDTGLAAAFRRLWEAVFGATVRLNREQYRAAIAAVDKAAVRKAITRNTSFWAIDWKKMVNRSENREWAQSFGVAPMVDAAQRYSWWKAVQGGVLPSSSLVHHYHPLAFLEWLAPRVPRTPVFYVERPGENGVARQLVVSKPDHLDPEYRDAKNRREAVWVYEHDRASWKLGNVQFFPFAGGDRTVGGDPGLVGIGFDGSPKLYQAIKGAPPSPSLPTMSIDKANVWASLWNSEGGLDALNAYDVGFLSVGAIQKTVGTWRVSGITLEGELGGALRHAKKLGGAAGDAFRRWFQAYGVDVEDKVQGGGSTETARLRLDGAPIDATSIHRIRWLVYSYCAKRALAEPEFARAFYGYGLGRFEDIRAFTKSFGGEPVSLPRLLRSQLAQAIVLDTHINRPELGARIWWESAIAARPASDPNKLALGKKIDWSTIDTDFEHAIVKEMIARRPHPTIYFGPQRSAFIVLCVEGLAPANPTAERLAAADALARSLGYASVADVKAKAGGKVDGYLYGFLKHERPST